MKTGSVIKIEAFFCITGAIGLMIWWFLMPVLLPVGDASENFKNLILDSNWIRINILGLVSSLFLTIGFPGFYIKYHDRFDKLSFVGLLAASVGLILFTCIQYYETFLWPAAAQVHPDLVQLNGALVSGNVGVVAGLITSGVFLGIGYILFGISALRNKLYPRFPLWLLIIGAPVFGNGIAFPIRTAGLLLFAVGTIWLAILIRRD